MSFVKVLSILLLLSVKNYAQEYTGGTVEEYINKKIEVINTKTTELIEHDVIKLREPAASLAFDKINGDKIKIITDIDGYFFILSVNELLGIRVNNKNVADLYFIGTLLDIEENDPIIDIQMERWKNFYMVIIQQSNKLKIYLVKFDVSDSPDISHIQKISIDSVTDRFKVFRKGEEIVMIIYHINENTANQLIFYTWQNSFFSKESTEEVNLPNKNNLFVFNEKGNETIIMSIGYGSGNQSTQVAAFRFNPETKRWMQLQKMRFKKDYVENFSIHGKLYLIGCSTDSFCAIYKWSGSNFQRHLKISSSVFEIIKFIYSRHNMILIEDFQNKLSLYSSSNIIGVKPGLTVMKTNEISEYSVYKSQEGSLYFVEVVKNETSIRTNFHEMTIMDVSEDERASDAKEIDPIECVMKLKASMKNRVATVKSSEMNAKKLMKNPGKFDISKKIYINAKYVNLKNTIVGALKMPYNVSVVKSDLVKRITSSNIKLEELKQTLSSGSTWNTHERVQGNFEDEFSRINVHNLIYNGSQPIFKNMLRKSQPILTFSDQIRVRNITANTLNIKSNTINRIPLNKLLNTTITKSVKGVKNLHTLKVDETQLKEMINNVPLTFLNSTENKLKQAKKIDFKGDINVQHLNVKFLNGFNVTKLMNDLYLKDSNTVIRGDLYVTGVFNVDNLFANHLKSIPINNFMTTLTDQTIETDVYISKFHASKISVNALNNEDESNFVLASEESYVEIPTKFMYLNVMKNLNIEETDVRDSTKSFVQLIKRHVIGTDAADLEQVYNGRVVIRGSLVLNDLTAFSPKTKIFVGNVQIPQNISEHYWTKGTKQQIYADYFHITNSAKLNGIITKNLNNHPVNNYLRIDSKDNQGDVMLRFENAYVEGDVKGHPNNFPSLLLQLSRNVIRIDGPATTISSPIEFRNKLVINKLYAAAINDISAKSMVHKHLKYVLFEAPKIIENLNVHTLVVDNDISISNYNNVNLQKFQTSAIFINRPIFLDVLKLESFNAFNTTINTLEGHDFNRMLANFDEELNFRRESSSRGSTKGKRSIRIHGDATFSANIFVELVNGELDFNEFINLLVLNDENVQQIGGRKIFQHGLVISDNLSAENINKHSMQRLLYQSLSRGDKQTISEQIFVKNLKVSELHTNKLNEIAHSQLIDRRKLNLPLKINIDLDEIEVMDLYTNLATLDFNDMLKIIQFPTRINWNSITAIKGSELAKGTESVLGKLINDGVLRSKDQEILAEVTIEKEFYVQSVKKADYIIRTRTTAWDMKYLFNDGVRDNSPNEIISGKKRVVSGYRFDANNLIIGPQCNFYSTYLNNMNILDFNKTIYRRGERLSAVKRFVKLEVDDLHIDGFLSGISMENILKISSDNIIKLPELTFVSLEVDNLKTYSFNTYSLLYFLKARLRKYGAEFQHIKTTLIFDSVQFDNDTEITSINSLRMDDAVFSNSHQLQIIDGHKIITGSVIIKGPAHIGSVNKIDLVEFHRKTINNQQDYRTEIPLKLSKIELRNGMHVTKNINDRNIDELLSSNAHSPKLNDLMTLIANVTQQITAIDHQKSVNKKRKRMLYIDVDENIDFQYKTPRSNDDNKCSVRNKIDFKPGPKTVNVIQKSELEMTVDLPSVYFRLNPNFDCEDDEISSKKVDFWWNYQNNKERSEDNYFQNFTFEKKVGDVKFMESSDGRFVLVIMLIQNQTKSDIIFMRLNKDTHELVQHQPTIVGYYDSTKIAIVESTDKVHYLIVSSFQTDTDADKIFVYKFDLKQGVFIQSQKPFTGGNYDIILSINVKAMGIFGGRTFLIFAKTNGKHIKIYQRKDETGEFVFQRMIDDFKDNIVEVIVLYVGEKPFIIVSQKSGLFCLYEWRGIESWKSKNCGRFENIRQMKSFEYLNRQHLFLASIAQNTTPSINALAIYRQGD